MANLIVGMTYNDYYKHTARDPITLISQLKILLNRTLQAHQTQGDLYIFMAPEFYFAKTGAPGQRYFNKNQKEQIIEKLLPLSRQRQYMLFIPGSILWKKGKEVRNTVPVIYRGNLIVAHDKLVRGGEVNPDEQGAYKYKMGSKPCYFEIPNDVTNGPGPIRCGLEVCMEHDLGILARYAKPTGKQYPDINDNASLQKKSRKEIAKNTFNADAHKLFFHLVTANTVSYRDQHEATKNGGYFIRCSATESGDSRMTIARQQGGALTDLSQSNNRKLQKKFGNNPHNPDNSIAAWKIDNLVIT